MGGKKKYIEMFGSFTEPFNFHFVPGANSFPSNFVHNKPVKTAELSQQKRKTSFNYLLRYDIRSQKIKDVHFLQ